MTGENLRDQLLEFMRSRGYQPMNKSELARHLEVPSERRSALRAELAALVAEGLLVEGRKSRFELRLNQPNKLLGVLKFHPKGHALFFPDPADDANLATGLDLAALSRIHVPRRNTATALDGDRVLVSLQSPKPDRESRRRFRDERPTDEPRGKVEKIVTRRSGRLVGVFHQHGRHQSVACDDKAIDGEIDIIGETTAQNGQLVVVDLTQWTDRSATPRGRIIEVLGWPGDAGVDMLAVIHRFGLRTSFPEEVLAAARATPEDPEPAEIARRKDWRDKLVITIDPADAKDHDDAIWLEKTARGWTLAVHIADVSHYPIIRSWDCG